MTNRLLLYLIFFAIHTFGFGQINCTWIQSVKKINVDEYDLILNVTINDGYFIYAASKEQDTSLVNPTKLILIPSKTYQLVGGLKESAPRKYYSDVLGINYFAHQNKATFTQRVRIIKKEEIRNYSKNKDTTLQVIHVKKEVITIPADFEFAIYNDEHYTFNPAYRLNFQITR